MEKNIITVEDPVEFQFSIINQVQVNARAGLNFATVLRNILRQDPDVVMIGEIRDKETADLAIRAALTGHLVISTIHTNDSVSTVTRLIDMGIEPFMVSSSIMGILSQRLVRKLCPTCRRARTLSPEEMAEFATNVSVLASAKIYEPVGCDACGNFGYRGRLPIFELLVPQPTVRKAIAANKTVEELGEIVNASGFQSMRVDGLNRVFQGLTSLDEILKATL